MVIESSQHNPTRTGNVRLPAEMAIHTVKDCVLIDQVTGLGKDRWHFLCLCKDSLR